MRHGFLITAVVFCSILPAQAAKTTKLPEGHYFLGGSGVGAFVSSNALKQSHANLANGTIPPLNHSKLSYGVGGVQLIAGYDDTTEALVNMRWFLQYLYLPGKTQRTAPFYQTTVYQTSFVNKVSVQSLLLNVGVHREIACYISLYADAGIGTARLTTNGTYETNASGLRLVDRQTSRYLNFTWQGSVGALIHILPEWNLNAGVHYINFGPINYGHFAKNPALINGVAFRENNLSAIYFNVGVEYAILC